LKVLDRLKQPHYEIGQIVKQRRGQGRVIYKTK
jgi:hypothetical protein